MSRLLATLAAALALSASAVGQAPTEDLIRAIRQNDLANLKAHLDK